MSRMAGPNQIAGIVWRETVEPKDVEDVRDLVIRTGVFSDAEVAIAAELVEETLRCGDAAGYAFVFSERGGRLVGYACFGPIPATVGSYDLYWIAVHPDASGCGIGSALLAKSELQIAAEGGKRVWIDTSSRSDYAPAHSLYTASGYREAARLDEFYGPNDSKLIFTKSLGHAAAESSGDR